MQATRKSRLESVILEEISTMVARELRDPRIPLVTFTKAEVSDDASYATLYFTILGAYTETTPEPLPSDEGPSGSEGTDPGLKLSESAIAELRESELEDCIEGLNSAAGFLRRNLAKAINIRHIPQLVFKHDKGLDNSLRVHELLNQLSSQKK